MKMRDRVHQVAFTGDQWQVANLLFDMADEIDRLGEEVARLRDGDRARPGYDFRGRPLAGDAGGYLARGGKNTEGI